jgi:hypothetical protein
VIAFNFAKLYYRLNDIGFQDVHIAENPSEDFIQAKITELLNDPEVTDFLFHGAGTTGAKSHVV